MSLNPPTHHRASTSLPDDAPLEYVADHHDIHTPAPHRRIVTDPHQAAKLLGNQLDLRITALLNRFPGRPTVLLSGGVDSIVVAATAQALGANPITLTVATNDSVDASAASAAAAALGLEHHLIMLTDEEVISLAQQAINCLGISELWEVAAAIPILAARQHLTEGAILTGSGADAILAGGRTLTHPLDSPEAVSELDHIVRTETAANFRRDRLVPHFYESLLNSDAGRLIHVFQTASMWRIAETLAPPALFTTMHSGAHDKLALRLRCQDLLAPHSRPLAWQAKNALQHSSGIIESLHRASRTYAAALPGATTYTDPRTESAEQVATRLYLATLPTQPR